MTELHELFRPESKMIKEIFGDSQVFYQALGYKILYLRITTNMN